MATYTVVSTMKNEAPYILEWVAHYRLLGFDNILVCTNDCADGTVRMLRVLEQLGHVQHHKTRIRAGGIHRSALRQAARYDCVQQADWVFVCDVDEFLNIHVGDGSVRDLVRLSGDDPDVIAVPWRIFGSNGIREIRDDPVTSQFTMAELPYDAEKRPETGKFVKSLFTNQEKFKRVGLHMPVVKEEHQADLRCVLPGGEPYVVNGQRTSNPPGFEVAQVNHYAVRSRDSYLVKRDRGRANHSHHVLGIEYWDRFNLNDTPDNSISRYDDGKGKIMAEFLEHPRLNRIHNKALAWHRERARAIREDTRLTDFVAQLEAAC